MSTTFKCKPTIDNNCLDSNTIIDGGGQIVEQFDGSVFVWINTPNGLAPYNEINTKPCCEYLGYTFDLDNQKCMWEEVSCDTCEMKVVINPNGSDGEYFFVGENTQCSLDISLDYIFKFDCDVLSSGETINENAILIQTQINDLNQTLTELEEQLPSLSATCEQYTSIYTGMCYAIRIGNHIPTADANDFYDVKEGGIGLRLPSNNVTICCLSESGLLRWKSILGDVKYLAWLNSNGCDTTIYTNSQANQLFTEGNNLAEENNGINPYLLETNDDLCGKQEAYLTAQEACDEYQNILNQIQEILNQINELQGQLDVLAESGLLCNDPIANLENFQAWFSLDVETDTPMLYESVYEQQIFGIGEGNLMQYISDNGSLTGIIISGETGVLPPFSIENTCDYDEICKSKRDAFIRELYLTQYVPLFGEPVNSLQNVELLNLMGGWYNSSWLNYSTIINDPEIIEKIKNRKIRISIKVNTCCLDFGILLDKINITQNCETQNNILNKISKPIGFDLHKIIDNKKSWVLNESPNKRTFYLDWRNTEYNINHGKLLINTKEIDLNVDPAKALEGDVFNYLNSNPCILDTSPIIPIETIIFNSYVDFDSILNSELQTCIPCINGQLTCDIYTTWGITATLNNIIIYENNEFYIGDTTTPTPTENMYISELVNIANLNDFIFTNNSGIIKFTNNSGVNIIGDEFKINLTLTIETCTPKEYQDNICFTFMDGELYIFEDGE
jgi:flagellar biosynthesis chaperone FliJ